MSRIAKRTAARFAILRTPGTLRGMVYMALSALSGTMMAALIRDLSSDLHPFVIAFFRSLFGFLILLPAFLRHGFGPLRTRRIGLHGVRGLVNVAVILFSFTALSLIPLAKVTAISFSSPLFATLFAVLLLGEIVRARRMTALVVGFAGTMLVIRPGVVAVDLGTMLAVGAAVSAAAGVIIVKWLARTEMNLTIIMYMGLVATPILFACALFVWRTPTPSELVVLVLMGAFGSATHLFMNQAIKEADIAVVSPVRFTQLIWASGIGYLAFAEVPDAWTWFGGLIIAGAISYMAYREHRITDASTGSTGQGPGRRRFPADRKG
ncbi:MAG TPA: DMT family transporter [Rhodospirillales bacterium]|nr:DMT family transporter [Rhodospirillales bacterium]HJO68832.1 DMT family transporter [Rhodospirillales bacterium]